MPSKCPEFPRITRRAPASRVARRSLLAAARGVILLALLPETVRAQPSDVRRLTLCNPNTDEQFSDVYWHNNRYVAESLDRINWLMRDYHRERVMPIDPRLLDLLHRLAERLETEKPFQVLSGYRTAATNRLLRHEGLAAAVNSEHVQAKAADIRIERVRLKHLRDAALSLEAGGVGTYWHEDFVHVDVGRVRSWQW